MGTIFLLSDLDLGKNKKYFLWLMKGSDAKENFSAQALRPKTGLWRLKMTRQSAFFEVNYLMALVEEMKKKLFSSFSFGK